MDQQHLQAFIALADTLHFGQASHWMQTSPSTFTRMIQKLEEEVGQALFIRDKRSVALSDAGKLFREYAESSVSQWESYKQQIAAQTNELSGELAIFSFAVVCSTLACVGIGAYCTIWRPARLARADTSVTCQQLIM